MAARAPTRHQKKAAACRGAVLFEDEASFWLDGTLHQTWSRVGVQPRVDTYGWRRTAHIFGAIALHDGRFSYRFEEVFNGDSFLRFLKQLVRRYRRQKVFLIIDNGPWHKLYEDGQQWLRANAHRIELHRLPPYSPEFNPMEGVWKTTRRTTTHNRFFSSTDERDAALIRTFRQFQRRPSLVAPQVLRFR